MIDALLGWSVISSVHSPISSLLTEDWQNACKCKMHVYDCANILDSNRISISIESFEYFQDQVLRTLIGKKKLDPL